jgi:hypothetical protein
LLASWPKAPREAARRVVTKYGLPDEAEARRLVWTDNGPWKRTTVLRASKDELVEFTAAYRVPLDRYELLSKLPGHVSAERGQEELSSRASGEALALLALNLADEVLSGKRKPEEASGFYETQAAQAAAGKGSPYTARLLFEEKK